MKKLLVLLVSAALVLSLAAVSMAAVTMSGEVSAKYDFEAGNDTGEAKIVADAKVNDQLSAKVAFKGTSGANVTVDEWNFIYNPGFAEVKVGFFGYKQQGMVDVIDAAFGERKPHTAVLLSKTLDSGFNWGFWWSADDDANGLAADQNAAVLNLGYANDTFDVDFWVVDFQNDNYDLGFSVAAALTLSENIIPYINYQTIGGDTGIADESTCILGVKFAYDALSVMAEMDLDDEFGIATDLDSRWGIKVNYTFSSGIYAEYKYATYDDAMFNETNYIKFGVKF